jgi:hypothetical protein
VVSGVWGVETAKKKKKKKQFSAENYQNRDTYSRKKIFMSTEMVPKLFPSLLSTYISAWKCSKNQI